jgi:hypothetical protein
MEASAHPAGPEAGGGDPRARERQEREKAWREAFNTALEQHVQNRGKGGKGKGVEGTSVLTEVEYQERLDPRRCVTVLLLLAAFNTLDCAATTCSV